jgi:uncharacterized SAM-dependent methyltransferase
MGSGSATKTRRIIEALCVNNPGCFICPSIFPLRRSNKARALLQSFEALRVEAYAGDYFDALQKIGAEDKERGRTLALFSARTSETSTPKERAHSCAACAECCARATWCCSALT